MEPSLSIQSLLTKGIPELRDDRTCSYCVRMPLTIGPVLLDTWKTALMGLDWQRPTTQAGGQLPRQTIWMANCDCHYAYGGVVVPAVPFSELLIEITTLVFETLDLPLPNACNLNLYTHGTQQVGWHDDSETLFASEDTRIISLSLGATRTFEIVAKEKLKKTRKSFKFATKSADANDIIPIELSQGDVLIMAGKMQQYYEHRLPPDVTMEPRINLTWRYITQHFSGCRKHN